MKTAIFCLGALLSCGVMARADEAAVQPEAPSATVTKAFALDLSVDADYYAFTDEIVVVAPKAEFDVLETLQLSVEVPVYNNTASTGLGDINIGAAYALFDGTCSFIGADKASLGVNGQFGLPLDGEFSSENPTWTVGGDLGLSWGKVGFTQTASYLFNDGEVFLPQFGGFVDGSVFSADTGVVYSFTDSFSVGGLFTQDYLDGGAQYLGVGPCATYSVHGIDFNLSVGFPVSQEDMPYGDADYTVSAGLGIKF